MAEKSIGSPSHFGFVFGTVVDRKSDPTQSGQVKVRWETGTISQSDLKDDELPYSRSMLGSQSASLKGIGGPHTGLIEGSRVVGVTISGDGQEVMILGSIPSSGNAAVDGQVQFNSNIPAPAKMQENNGRQQPTYGDKNGVVEEYKNQSVVAWAESSGGPEKTSTNFGSLNDSCGSFGSSEGPHGSSICTLLS